LNISKPRSASSRGRVWVMIRVGSIWPFPMRCSRGSRGPLAGMAAPSPWSYFDQPPALLLCRGAAYGQSDWLSRRCASHLSSRAASARNGATSCQQARSGRCRCSWRNAPCTGTGGRRRSHRRSSRRDRTDPVDLAQGCRVLVEDLGRVLLEAFESGRRDPRAHRGSPGRGACGPPRPRRGPHPREHLSGPCRAQMPFRPTGISWQSTSCSRFTVAIRGATTS
jgi:hypothetical protein